MIRNHKAKSAFGLDLGGYSSGGSALALASRGPSRVEITVYRGHAFMKKPGKGKPFPDIVAEEVELLAACLQEAPLYVDVPIDLQRLPCPGGEVFAWQLVKRPVDQAFGALPPLADRIGSVVARFSNLLRALRVDYPKPLGQLLYETYPAGSLRLLEIPHERYKEKNNSVKFEDGKWVGYGAKGERLAELTERLGLIAGQGEKLNHDEFDAVICALTGVVEETRLLRDNDLKHTILKRLGSQQVDPTPPKGYVLLQSWPEDWKIWLKVVTVRGQCEMLNEVTKRSRQ